MAEVSEISGSFNIFKASNVKQLDSHYYELTMVDNSVVDIGDYLMIYQTGSCMIPQADDTLKSVSCKKPIGFGVCIKKYKKTNGNTALVYKILKADYIPDFDSIL